MRKFFIMPALGAGLMLAACSASQAPDHAAAKPASAASTGTSTAAAGLGGEPVTGVCLLSRQAIFANAKVGQAANQRLQQLAQQGQGYLDAERGLIDTQLKTLRSASPSLAAAERQRREQALAPLMRKIEQDSEQLRRQLELTRQRATEQIAQAAQPLLAQVYQQHHCGLLLDRHIVLGGNTRNDLTADVVQILDAKLQSISFDLATLPSTPPAPSASTH